MIPHYLKKYIYYKNDILTFHNCVYDKRGKLWVYSNRMAACFSIDLHTYTSRFFGWNEKCSKIGYAADIIGIYHNFLISITRDSSYVEKIDLDTGNKEYIELQYEGLKKADNYANFIVDDKLVLVPYKSNEIIVFNLEEICLHKTGIGKIYLRNKRGEAVHKAVMVGHAIALLSEKTSVIEWFDLQSFTFFQNEGFPDKTEIVDIVISEGKKYVLSAEGSISIYEENTGRYLKEIKNEFEQKNGKYGKLLIVGEKIFIFPSTKDQILIFDTVQKKHSLFNEYPADYLYQFPEFHSKFQSFCEDENNIYVGQRSANYMLIISKKTAEINWVQIRLPREFIAGNFKRDTLEDAIGKNKVLSENVIDLKTFLETNCEKYINRDEILVYGKAIYRQNWGNEINDDYRRNR